MAYTNIDDPSAYFQVATWTGTNATGKQITNDGNSDLQPDFIWAKARTSTPYTDNHFIVDSSRGRLKGLVPNDASAETTTTGNTSQQAERDLESFDTDGFTVGIVNSTAALNASSEEHVAWQWKCNGGTTSTNTNGSVNSTVQVNTTAGFSIVQWASDGTPDTIGHGLSQAPDWIFMKSTVSGLHWFGYSRKLGPGKQHLLALTYIQSNTSVLNNTDPSSTVFYTNHSDVSSGGMIAYCFHEVQGYSKFGEYVGNGSTNGPFVHLGFKPAFVMMRNATTSGDSWAIFDNKRSDVVGANVIDKEIAANETSAEYDRTAANTDFLSNGFKIRNTDGWHNRSGNTYIYMAFAESPFVTSTGIPTTAR